MAGAPVKTRPHNLPAELTSFVGRRRELSEVKRLLSTSRLLTLTGSGGAGKTRLALRAAAELARSFRDGVWLVSLASINDPDLVVQAVAHALGLQDTSSALSPATLVRFLEGRQLLLVLDNCEHLLDACAQLSVTLLTSCPELRVLATSRQALGVTGETRMRVPPLSVPEDGAALAPEQIATFEAVSLLLERATAVQPAFKIDRTNAHAVLGLCRHLDGMPLALELAAVRLEGLTVEQVVSGLESELPVLAKGARGGEARQQTLEATLGWSYGLLDEEERLLWARLSVFIGGFDEQAALGVCADDRLSPEQVEASLALLVEKSIVQRDGGRYQMLETVRHYGRHRLRDIGEYTELLRRHRDWVLELAREASSYDHRQAEAFSRVRLELDNVWSALDFCRTEPGEAAAGFEICFQLHPYWLSRGPLGDVRRLLDAFLPLTAELSWPRVGCAALAAVLAAVQNDSGAEAMAEEALRQSRAAGDEALVVWASNAVLFTALHNRTDDQLLGLAQAHIAYGESSGAWYLAAIGFSSACVIYLNRGELQEAIAAGERAVDMCREAGELWIRGQTLNNLSEVWRRLRRLDQAEALARESAAGKYALGDRRGLALVIDILIWVAADRGAHARTATLLGYVERLRESIAVPLPSHHREREEAAEQAARRDLGEAGFARAFERGASLDDAEAIDFVLEKAPARVAVTPAPPAAQPSILTRRELEIAHLIAEGLTSQQIGAKLFISERTVTTHVTNMLNKLGFSSRTQLASWVTAQVN